MMQPNNPHMTNTGKAELLEALSLYGEAIEALETRGEDAAVGVVKTVLKKQGIEPKPDTCAICGGDDHTTAHHLRQIGLQKAAMEAEEAEKPGWHRKIWRRLRVLYPIHSTCKRNNPSHGRKFR